MSIDDSMTRLIWNIVEKDYPVSQYKIKCHNVFILITQVATIFENKFKPNGEELDNKVGIGVDVVPNKHSIKVLARSERYLQN